MHRIWHVLSSNYCHNYSNNLTKIPRSCYSNRFSITTVRGIISSSSVHHPHHPNNSNKPPKLRHNDQNSNRVHGEDHYTTPLLFLTAVAWSVFSSPPYRNSNINDTVPYSSMRTERVAYDCVGSSNVTRQRPMFLTCGCTPPPPPPPNHLRRKMVKVPPRFGTSLPRLPVPPRRNANTNDKGRQSMDIHNRQQNQTFRTGQRRYRSTDIHHTTGRSSMTAELEQKVEKEMQTKDRSDCPLCKKFSRGPCGDVFTRWMDCIDSVDGEGGQSRCDDFLRSLDDCLKDHKAFYDQIDVYDEEEEERVGGGGGGGGDGGAAIADLKSAWRDLISDLESRRSDDHGDRAKNGDGRDDSIRFLEFTGDMKPNMEFRPRDGTGMVQFHPVCSSLSNNGKKKAFIMGFVKGRNGAMLGAGSSEDLFLMEDEDGRDVLVLRFKVADQEEAGDVTAFALYEDEDVSDDGGEGELVMFYMTQRLPSKS